MKLSIQAQRILDLMGGEHPLLISRKTGYARVRANGRV